MSPAPDVVVAMSGGVDSSVAAGLLIEQGYSVVGMMLRLWSLDGNDENNRCCTPDAVKQARRVAAILGIPFYVIDAEKTFYEKVVEPFLESHRRGETPNPCVLCNRLIRWGFLLEKSQSIGARYLATGHYARVEAGEYGSLRLLKGLDASKDQSYVLSRLNQHQLGQSLFPLGGMLKSEVRSHARRMGLPVAERQDSQDLCFVSREGFKPFLTREVEQAAQPGKIVNQKGEIVGEHQGLAFYTIGQRKGIRVSAAKPLYVAGKDIQQNILLVSEGDAPGVDSFYVADVHWVSGSAVNNGSEVQVKIRYKAQPASARVEMVGEFRAWVQMAQPLRDVTPGQLAVFYHGEVVLGSGFIEWR